MFTPGRNDECPCGSGRKYKKCCGPYLEGTTWPEAPEALMRSRYTAYAVGHAAHLVRTAHPEHESRQGIDPERFARETLVYCQRMEFTGLTIHKAVPEDDQGVAQVHFTARYRAGGKEDGFTELSEFVRYDGRWVYRTGRYVNELETNRIT